MRSVVLTLVTVVAAVMVRETCEEQTLRQHRRHNHLRRHHTNKYPNLDGLLGRLDQAPTHSTLPVSTTPTSMAPTTTPSTARPVSFHLDDDYDDTEEDFFEDDASHKSSNGIWPQTDRDTDYQDNQPSDYSYTNFKWQVLGNRQRMEHHRRHMLTSRAHQQSKHPQPATAGATASAYLHQQHRPVTNHNSEHAIREAIQHALRVTREGSCKHPRPKVIQVKDLYPHPSKTYIPHCTILHQCGDDTGCCRHETLTCGPKTTQKVELYFYTTALVNPRGNTIEKLDFYNHTECECADKLEEMMPRDPSKMEGRALRVLEPGTQHPKRVPEERSCRCPSDFAVRHHPDGACSCDCFDKQRTCIRLKRGRDYFSVQDRWCLQVSRCEIPSCEYGHYISRAGRCPRKKERFNSWNRYLMDGGRE